jgi:hypothetical protein
MRDDGVREGRWLRALALAAAFALAFAGAAAPLRAEPAALYQWTDAQGVIRYTPDPSRVPDDRRGTMVRVELGTPGATAAPPRLPEPDLGIEPDDAVVEGPAPFNAPEQASRVESVRVEEPAPALEARRSELEAAIAADEEALKALISEAPVEGSDALIDSDELREIARRLPELQAELEALEAKRRRREQR